MIKEFKEFINKGGVFEAAVGLIMALAFAPVVNGLVDFILMPIVAAVFGQPDFSNIGFDIGVSMPRGMILPPNAPVEVQEWWIGTMKQVVETPEWGEYIASNTLTPTVIYGEEFRTFLKRTKDGFEVVLRDVGAID